MKKILVEQEKKKELTGFEGIYGLINDKIVDAGELKSKITNDKLADNYDLYDFLEIEFKRLQKINEILTKKLDNFKNYPQTETLINLQKEQILSHKQKLIELLVNPNHTIHNELSILWETALAYKN